MEKEEEFREEEIEYDDRIAGSQNPFEKSNGKADSNAESDNLAYHILKIFQAEFPLCPWTPKNCIDFIQNKILASKLWTEKEIARGIKELAKKFRKRMPHRAI